MIEVLQSSQAPEILHSSLSINEIVDIVSNSVGIGSKFIITASYTNGLLADGPLSNTLNIKYSLQASIQTENDIVPGTTIKEDILSTTLLNSDHDLDFSNTIEIKEEESTDIDNIVSITTGKRTLSISYTFIIDNIFYNI